MVAVSGDRPEQESKRQESLIYGGLIGIGVVMVQPFLTVAAVRLILWIAGAVMLAFAIIAVGVHSAGYSRLILDRRASAHDSGRLDDPRG